MKEPRLVLGPDLVKLIAEIDEFKGRWEALKTLPPDRLDALRKVATIESVGSSTRIEGAKLSDAEVEDLLSRAISIKSFRLRSCAIRNTLKVRLRELVADARVRQHGKARATWYSI